MRARPLGVVLVAVGSGLSVATTPVPLPSGSAATPGLSGVVEVEPGVPATLALQVEVACVAPEAVGEAVPLTSIALDAELLATALDGPPDTAARTWVSATATVDGEVTGADEAWLGTYAERLAPDVVLRFDACTLGEPCHLDVAYTFEADAAVEVAWSARARVEWTERTGQTCQIFLFEA